MPKKVSRRTLQKLTPRASRTNAQRNLNKLKKKIAIAFQNDFLLAELGITVEQEKKDYSLKTIAMDEEFIENPKIIEMDNYKRIQKKYDKPDDKYRNEDDPFYQLDDKRDNFESKIKNVQVADASKRMIVNFLFEDKNIKQVK